MSGTPEYEEGLRDGRLVQLERRADLLDQKVDHHEKRLIYLERIAASMLAIIAFTTVMPKLLELHAYFENVNP